MTSTRGKTPTQPEAAAVERLGGPAPLAPSPDGREGIAGRPERAGLPRDVLERVRIRDPEALAALFDRYFDLVYGLAYRLLGERWAAEDTAQEVFYKVHRAAHQLDPARDPGAWLVGITYNACRDLWRSRAYKLGRRSSSVEGHPGLEESLAARTPTPEQHALAAERERLVQEAILELPERLREAVVLHDYQGLNHDEIAALTGASHAAVRKRYSRALAALGRRLKESLG